MKNIIYVGHPFGNKKYNVEHLKKIISELIIEHPDETFISPVIAFGFAYDLVSYEKGMDDCLNLLSHAKKMIMISDPNGDSIESSKGCLIEIQYCKDNNIPIEFINK